MQFIGLFPRRASDSSKAQPLCFWALSSTCNCPLFWIQTSRVAFRRSAVARPRPAPPLEMNFLFLFLLRRKMNYLSCGWMVLPTNSAALFDRLRCRSRERRRDPVGFWPSLSLNSLTRSIESTQEYVRDPGAYRPATYYQLYASRFTARICFDATLWSIGHSLPRDDEAQSSAGSHTSFSVSRELFTLHMLVSDAMIASEWS